jgi:protein-disulfide isomerase
MHRYSSYLLLTILIATLAAAQHKPAPSKPHPDAANAPVKTEAPGTLPSEDTVNAFMKSMFGHDPSVTWKIESIRPSHDPAIAEVSVLMSNAQGQQMATFFVTPGQHYAVTGEMIPFGADPFAPARAELEKAARGPARGPANAPVLLVEFSDLQCPHCKDAQPTIDRLLSEEPNVRFVFQNFPLPMHNWAYKAAAFADCVAQQNNDAFWKFIKAVYDDQQNITESNAEEKLTAAATAAGANGQTASSCAASANARARVEQSLQLGKVVDVNSTPTLFINGRKMGIGGVPYELLKSMVDYQAKQAK